MPIDLRTHDDRRKVARAKKPTDTAQVPIASSSSPHLPRALQAPNRLQPTDVLHLQRTVGNRAVSNLLGSRTSTPNQPIIQRTPVDPDGNEFKMPKLPKNADDDVEERWDETDDEDNTFVFEDQASVTNFILNGDESLVKKLYGVTADDFRAKLDEATEKAEYRYNMFPFKRRASASSAIFARDNPGFHKLSPDQLPKLPDGNYFHRSRKHDKYKIRTTDDAETDWKMAMYQDSSSKKAKVAYNMLQDGTYLDRTLFQTGEGKGLGKGNRKMAGLEGTGKTPKWKDDSIDSTGAKRKLNSFPHKALVQGHGQDYEASMDWFGDYDADHLKKKSQKLTKAANPIVTSDDHPANFSPEHPIYGQNFRNYILNHARTQYPGGSILEETKYFTDTLDVNVPKGFGDVKVPKKKTLTLMSRKGKPKERYSLDQLRRVKGGFNFVDYADIAETHSGKGAGQVSMEDLRLASKRKVPKLSKINPSYVSPGRKRGINSPKNLKDDSKKVKGGIKKHRRRKSFHYFKEKDFT